MEPCVSKLLQRSEGEAPADLAFLAGFRSHAVLLRLNTDSECNFCRHSPDIVKAGSKDAFGFMRAGEFTARVRAAASIIGSVTRLAPEAVTASPMAGKI